jgi:predicted esterase
VDKSSVSVSGLSSGAFFAVQFHVAYSSTITGAGIIAGGPFFCAQDNLSIALTSCTKDPVLISVTELVAITHNTAATFTIDSPDNLKNDKVFVFAGTLDSVVHSGVGRKLVEYYGHFVQEGNIDSVFSIPSEHGFVSRLLVEMCMCVHVLHSSS